MKEQKTKHEEAAAVAAATRQEASERDAKTHAEQDRSNEAAMAAAAASQQLAAAQRKATVTLTSNAKFTTLRWFWFVQLATEVAQMEAIKERRSKRAQEIAQAEERTAKQLKRQARDSRRGEGCFMLPLCCPTEQKCCNTPKEYQTEVTQQHPAPVAQLRTCLNSQSLLIWAVYVG